jgi:chromosome segregation ATPase
MSEVNTTTSLRSLRETSGRKAFQSLENLPLQEVRSRITREDKLNTAAQCATCRVLAGQVDRIAADMVELESQTKSVHSETARLEASLQAAESLSTQLTEENAAMQQRCIAEQCELEHQQAVSENAWVRWRDEVTAWRTLHNDAKRDADAASVKIHDLEKQRSDLQKEVNELPASIETIASEVMHLHALQSSIQAQSLQDADRIRLEVQKLQRMADRASEDAASARERRFAAEKELTKLTDGLPHELSRLKEYAGRCKELEQEVSVSHEVIKELRLQCIEEQKRCSHAVNLLQKAQPTKSDKGCSPRPDSTLVDLTSELECRMERARTLEASNETIRNQRRHEAETCRQTVEQLRTRIRRYRALFDDQELSPYDDSPYH